MEALGSLRTDLSFEQMHIKLSDDNRHWQFVYGDRPVAEFWPASGIGTVLGLPMRRCTSPAQAKRLAIDGKAHVFRAMADVMRGRKEEEDAI